ncbi:hypothetical protein AWV80_37025 [Cupriavidus sp. UYMU48A]|nr:hypothetical protein AWV80_37025 [Cupriavidus sp. UYMU48A]
MRGLYAWTAAHLARHGNDEDARRLVEADAVTVLAYGDAAVFSTACRQAMLDNLDRHDPYFRAADHWHADGGDTVFGSLASDDLVEDFVRILTDRDDATHRFLTVTDVLTHAAHFPRCGRCFGGSHGMLVDLIGSACVPPKPGWQVPPISRLRCARCSTR